MFLIFSRSNVTIRDDPQSRIGTRKPREIGPAVFVKDKEFTVEHDSRGEGSSETRRYAIPESD